MMAAILNLLMRSDQEDGYLKNVQYINVCQVPRDMLKTSAYISLGTWQT